MADRDGFSAVPQYLFVFTRPIATAASARYLLRQAATLCRQGHPVTLFLTPEALSAPLREPDPLLDGMRICLIEPQHSPPAPARLLRKIDRGNGSSAAPPGALPATELELAQLMLDPRVATIWC